MSEKKGAILKQSFAFAIQIINSYKILSKGKKEYTLSRQLLRSGTAVGALLRKTQNAESKADLFINLELLKKIVMSLFTG